MARKIDIEHLNTYTAYLAETIYKLFVKKVFGKGLSENDYTDEEKAKLSGIAEGANRTVTDPALSDTSENPVQNKAVKAEADRLQGEIDQKAPSSRTVNGQALTANVNLTAADVGADAGGSAATALQSAKAYADKKIVDLVGGAPETLDTLKEVADALEANEDVVEALDAAIGTKASAEALQAHINNQSNPHNVTKALVGLGNVENKTGAAIRGEMTKAEVTKALGYTPSQTDTTYGEASQSAAGLMSAGDKAKLDGVASGANAYSHPASSGNRHVPAGGSAGQILRWSADGTAAWGSDNNTTYGAATQSSNGLMSAADKTKLDGIASGANNYTYTHPTSAGNKHIPGGGEAGQILRWSAAGTAAWGADNNTTYGVATQSANGLMSSADKKKLDGIVLEEETDANIDKIIAGTYA